MNRRGPLTPALSPSEGERVAGGDPLGFAPTRQAEGQQFFPAFHKAFFQPKILGSDHCPVGIELTTK